MAHLRTEYVPSPHGSPSSSRTARSAATVVMYDTHPRRRDRPSHENNSKPWVSPGVYQQEPLSDVDRGGSPVTVSNRSSLPVAPAKDKSPVGRSTTQTASSLATHLKASPLETLDKRTELQPDADLRPASARRPGPARQVWMPCAVSTSTKASDARPRLRSAMTQALQHEISPLGPDNG